MSEPVAVEVPPHLSAEEFRRRGHAAIDWVAAYLEGVGERPVAAAVTPGAVAAALPDGVPEVGEGSFDAVLADLDRLVVPALTHWQHPGFFAYFPANASGPSILGELLSAGLGVQGMLWSTSPACTEVEQRVLDWVADLLDLPAGFRGGGVIQDSASSATLCALLAARERATGGRSNEEGVAQAAPSCGRSSLPPDLSSGPPPGGLAGRLTVYASSQAHSSVEKAVRVIGLGSQQLRLVGVDAAYAMDPAALARVIAADRDAGATPAAVVATVGTTSSTALDPLRAIGELCRREGVWLHVDAAYAGSAAVCPEHRAMHDGLELADSYAFNPHKWLLVNFDCSCLYVTAPEQLVGALAITPEYLRNAASDSGTVVDYRDWQVPLGRRFRALKLWLVLRHYGVQGLRAHIRRHVAWARDLAARVEAHPRLELAAPVSLSLVCLRHRAGDAATQALLRQVNASGRALVSHTVLDGRVVLRVAIGGTRTEAPHVEALWDQLDAAAR